MIKWNPLYTQDGISPLSLPLNELCDWVVTIIFLILTSVTWFYFTLTFNKFSTNLILEHKSIEFAWTGTPIIILSLIASISIKTLYLEEPSTQPPVINLIVTGHQWYWEYYYPDFNINFDRFLTQWEDSNYRNLECDTRTLLPIKTPLRIAVTSADVIHRWSVPSLIIKLDATPGRIISFNHYSNLPGISFGFCAELCGVNHRYIPIALEHTSVLLFKNWLSTIEH